MNKNYTFTSESVTEGHPDKVSDQISDAILDAILENDPDGRVACETLTTTDLVVISGEITTHTHPDYESIVRETVRGIGYANRKVGFHADTLKVQLFIDEQSPHIAQGVDEKNDREQGAGDQGLMFGFACKETPELMPLPIILSHRLAEQLAAVRKNGTLPWLRPDGKTQVSVEYDGFTPVKVTKIVVATQHLDMFDKFNDNENDELSFIRMNVIEHVIQPVLNNYDIDYDKNFIINGTGRFVEGGPKADTGLTGRKIIVDTYGGYARHGGGAFSGKDPSKVDRSAAYMTRYIAKNIVAAELAERCEVQLAYSIGVAEPVSVLVETFGTGKLADESLTSIVKQTFNLKPTGIIKTLDLKRPIYQPLAAYGHLGRSGLSWEKIDKVEQLKILAIKENVNG
ncbi:MAG: methionine adenosyltransferase [Candidatus Marinimicrobia bacterium]|nr:methionine adenosyltransferase [Candidatus Neomarinimicrobiota bacterium]